MKVIATIALSLAVLVASLFFLACSLCAMGTNAPLSDRATFGLLAMVSLVVIAGGIFLIARIHRKV